MNVDALTTRGRGLGAAVAVVLGLLLGVPSAAQATLSITASPASPRPGEPVTFSTTGTCDDICVSWSIKVGTQAPFAAGFGEPIPSVLEDGFATATTYTVTLSYVASRFFIPRTVTVTKQVTVVANRGPTAKFSASPASPTIGQAVTFTDTSTDPEGDRLTRAWDLDNDGLFNDGDGTTASRSFTTRGTKTVRLRVRDTYGAESIATQTVTVANVSPTVALNVTPTTAQTGEPVAFSAVGADPDGGTVTYAWDLDGDGVFTDSSAASPPARSYPRSGTRTIGVRVTDDDGDPVNSTVQRSQVITVTNRPPTAPTISATPASVPRGGNVQLTASATDPEGTAITYDWDFNSDGDYTDATGTTVTRPMPSSGVLTAKARATDADGGSAVSGTFTLTAENRAPTAGFTFAPGAPVIGQAVTFTDTSSDPDGDPITRAWDLDNDGAFDDGTGSTASWTYPTRGAKTVRLEVRDTSGAQAVATRTVTVGNVAPTATLTASATTVDTGTPVTFSVTGADPDGGPVTYSWDLDDDGTFGDSTAASPPAQSWPRSGSKTVRVRVADDDGDPATSTTERTVTITVTNRPPTAPTISATPASVPRGGNVQLTAAATDPEGTAITYGWDFNDDGDYTDATGATVTRPMPSSGVLNAKARASDADGGSAVSGTFTLTADNRTPTAGFTFAPSAPVIGQAVTFTDTSSDPDGDPITRAWDLDNDGAFDDGTGTTATRTFTTRGTKTVRLEVRDASGAQAVATRTVTVGNVAPTATLTASATTVDTGAPVTFSVTGADPDGGPVTYSWDLDGNGTFGDSTAASPPARSWPRSGSKTVRVRVTDDDADPATSTTERTVTITVRNRVPSVPSVEPLPLTPSPGAPLELRATATDPEGTDLVYAWDLDADGAFDDATGASVTTTFPLTGDLLARVRATDADGGATDSPELRVEGAVPVSDPGTITPAGDAGTPFTSDVPVAAATPAPPVTTATPNPPVATPLRLLRPFPRVRIQGRLTRRGARFTRVTVTGPAQTKVAVRCSGGGCPFGSTTATVGRSGSVRLTKLLGTYRAGTTIVFRVTRDGAIGKYTKIVVRKGRAPAREDRCLKPSATAPSRCPAN